MPTDATQPSDELLDYLWEQRAALRHRAWCEFRYHRKRERFFDLFDKGTKSITVLLGAALFGPKVQQYAAWVGTAVAAMGLMPLIFNYSDRKRLHQELATDAAGLAQAIEGTPTDKLTAERLADWGAGLAALDGKAPPPLKGLMQLCAQEQGLADGDKGYLDGVAPKGLRRLLAQFI